MHRRGEPGLQVDHPPPGQEIAGARVEDGAAAEREHAGMAADQPGRGGAFERPERLLAVLDEDVADRLARRLLDDRVGIHEIQPEPGGDQRADGGLARAGRPDAPAAARRAGLPGRDRPGRVRGGHFITSEFR